VEAKTCSAPKKPLGLNAINGVAELVAAIPRRRTLAYVLRELLRVIPQSFP
jgi:hypothetical protein